MKLGLQLGYWGAQPPDNHAELVAAAEDAGFDAVFTAEAWGSDAYTPLAWWGASTSRLRLGTSVVQLSARTPTACAMEFGVRVSKYGSYRISFTFCFFMLLITSSVWLGVGGMPGRGST